MRRYSLKGLLIKEKNKKEVVVVGLMEIGIGIGRWMVSPQAVVWMCINGKLWTTEPKIRQKTRVKIKKNKDKGKLKIKAKI